MSTRRQFVRSVAAGAGMLALPELGSAAIKRARVAPLRILILGGTGFLGPNLVHVARTRGHTLSMLNRGRREPGLFEADFRDVESIRGDRAEPNGLDGLRGRTWDVVIETSGYRHAWTRTAAQALKGSAGRYLYVSSTGVFWPYRTVDIDEGGRIVLADDPPRELPTYGVMKALSENEVRTAFGNNALIIRPGYIVGPGDLSDRWTYWPMRVPRGGEILVPGKPDDQVQYLDVRDLSAWMIALLENGTNGTFNAVGPARRQTMREFVFGLAALTNAPLSWTWVDDYAFLERFPLRPAQDGEAPGLIDAIPWVMPTADELGHMRIDGRRAWAAGLDPRPLADTARDTFAWRGSNAVPQALRDRPRYVLDETQEKAILEEWKKRPR